MKKTALYLCFLIAGLALCGCSNDDDETVNVDVRIATSVTVHIPKSVTICGEKVVPETDPRMVLTLEHHRNDAKVITIPRSRLKDIRELYDRSLDPKVLSWINIEASDYSPSINMFRVCTKVSPDKKRLLLVICKVDEPVYAGILAYYQSFYSK